MKTAKTWRARARKLFGSLVPTRWQASPQPGADKASQNANPQINVVDATPTGTPTTSPHRIRPYIPSPYPSLTSIVSETQPSGIFDANVTTNTFNSIITRPSAVTVTEDPTTWAISMSRVDTDYVYAVKNTRPAVYVAKIGRELDPPALAKAAYEKNARQDLEHQLQVVYSDIVKRRDEQPNRKIRICQSSAGQPRSRVCQNPPQVKLEMSGTLAVDGSLILRPAIRIECDDGTIDKIRAAIRSKGFERFREMPGFSDIRVVKGPRATSATGQEMKDPQIQYLGLDEFDGELDVEFHLGFLPTESASQGAVCRTTLYHNGARAAVRYTRVGGLLDVDGCSICVTTAHQIFDGLVQEIQGPLPTESDEEDGDDDPDTCDIDTSLDHGCKTFPPADYTQITKWTQASLGADAFYGGLHIKPAKWKRSRIVIRRGTTITSDFAVLHLGWLRRKKLAGKLRSVSPTASNIDTSTTQILLGGDEMCRAFPCPGKDRVTAYGRHVRTTLLGLDYALPPGSSGSWVVKGGGFLGMIIAGYDGEPLAHMISAEDLVADVRAAISGKVLACRSIGSLLSSLRPSRIFRINLPWGRPREIQSPRLTSAASAPVPSRHETTLDSSSGDNSSKRLKILDAAPTTPLEALNTRGHPRTVPTSAPNDVDDLQLFNPINATTPTGFKPSYATTILDEDLAAPGAEAASAPRVNVLIDSTRFHIADTWFGMGEMTASTTVTIPSSISTRTTSALTSIGTDTISNLTEPTLTDKKVKSPPTVPNKSRFLRFSSPCSTSKKNDEPCVDRRTLRSCRSLPVVNDSRTDVDIPSPRPVSETYTTKRLPENRPPVKKKGQHKSPSRIKKKLLRNLFTRYETEAPNKNKKTPITTCAAEKTPRIHGPHMLERAISIGERFGWRLHDDRSPVIRELDQNSSALLKGMDSSSKRRLPLAESILLRHAEWESLFRLLSCGVDVQYLDLADPLRVLKRPWTCTCGAKRELFLESQTVSKSLAARLLEDYFQKEDFINLRSIFKVLLATRGFR